MMISLSVLRRRSVARAWVALACLGIAASAPVFAADYYDAYGLSAHSPALDLGSQPLGYPSGVLSSVMARDRLLKAALATAGAPLSVHPFRRGADMVGLLAEGRLETGLLGDVPTILSAATGATLVVGLVKQSATAVVARSDWQVQALAGKRIGYVEASSAHHTLLQGLAAGGLSETDVTLIKLRIDEMVPALERGHIDAFAAWEPAPSAALAASANHRIVFRGLSTDYLVINRLFAERQPEAARHLVAGYLRALHWLRLSRRNVEQAAVWVLADGRALSDAPAPITPMQIAQITRRDILDVPGAPAILRSPGRAPLEAEYRFLERLGKLPPAASMGKLTTAFAYDGLAQVARDPQKYRPGKFDYGD